MAVDWFTTRPARAGEEVGFQRERKRVSMRMFSWRTLCAFGVTVALAAGLEAGGSFSAAARTAPVAAAAAAAPSCVPPTPSKLPSDPNGVAATLTGRREGRDRRLSGHGVHEPVGHFKPKHGPPWKIGMSNNEGNLNAVGRRRSASRRRRSANPGKVSSIVSTTPATPNDVTAQIQQMRSLLQQNVDIIISTLGSPTALNAVIDQAAKQNVPVISMLGQSTDKNAVNLQPNPIQLGYYGAAGLVHGDGSGKGNVLIVHGIPGLSINTGILKGGEAVLKACHVNIVGTVAGKFDPTIAKTQVLTFLHAHPGTVNGVFQVSDMAPGIFSAFQQVGRPVPPVGDIGARPRRWPTGSDNASKGYKGTGVAIPPSRMARTRWPSASRCSRAAASRSPTCRSAPPVITTANLSQWVQARAGRATRTRWPTVRRARSRSRALVNTYFNKP